MKEINLGCLSNQADEISKTIVIEISLLAKLNHQNIIKYYGAFRKGNHLNILLENCIGGSLSSLLKTYSSFKESLIKKYTLQILLGIEYLHSHNIIHRDIKCANILVTREGICRLSDFGGAKIIKDAYDLTKQTFEGTPNWIAPETVRLNKSTRFSDIWSIGCTVLEMFNGFPPWSEHKNQLEVLSCIYKCKEPPPIPEEASEELQDFLKKCLVIEPKKRWNVYQLLRHPFIVNGDNIEKSYTGTVRTVDNLRETNMLIKERKLILKDENEQKRKCCEEINDAVLKVKCEKKKLTSDNDQ